MKSLVRFLPLVVLLALIGCGGPDFQDLDGNGHRYADIRGKWVVINYWATWCAPCLKEIPELNQLAEEHADKLVVYGVNWDDPELEEAKKQASRMKISFPVYANDPSEALGIDKPEVLPTTFLYAPGFKYAGELVGPQTGDSILAAMEGGDPRPAVN